MGAQSRPVARTAGAYGPCVNRKTHSHTQVASQDECGSALYAWDIEPGHQSGVTDDRGKAIGNVHDALADAHPSASGLVRRVKVGGASGVRYITLDVVGVAHRDPVSGAVEWMDGGPW
jgi:hypothetical protein